MKRLILAAWAALFTASVSSEARASEAGHFISGGLVPLSYEISGSNYLTRGDTNWLIQGRFGYFKSPQLRMGASVASDIAGDMLSLSAGAAYHFQPYLWSTAHATENVDYVFISTWSPYVGIDFTLTRVQLSLVQKENVANSDMIVGGVFGPTFRIGTLMAIDQDFGMIFELLSTYGFSNAVGLRTYGVAIELIYRLP